MAKLALCLALCALLAGAAAAADAAAAPSPAACKTVAEIASANPDLSTLVAAVTASPDALKLLSSNDPNVTVFAPTNAAFAAALKALNLTPEALLKDTKTLTNVLLYHVAPGLVTSKDLKDGPVPTLLKGADGAPATVGVKLADGVALTGAGSPAPIKVVKADIPACGAVIHVVDGVLVPKMDAPKAETASAGRKML